MAVETGPIKPRLSSLYDLPGVTYPKPGEQPRSLDYSQIVAKFPWAVAVKDELVVMYKEQRRLSGNFGQNMDMKDMSPEDAKEYGLLIARSEGIIRTVNLLGLGAINSTAKDELPPINY